MARGRHSYHNTNPTYILVISYRGSCANDTRYNQPCRMQRGESVASVDIKLGSVPALTRKVVRNRHQLTTSSPSWSRSVARTSKTPTDSDALPSGWRRGTIGSSASITSSKGCGGRPMSRNNGCNGCCCAGTERATRRSWRRRPRETSSPAGVSCAPPTRAGAKPRERGCCVPPTRRGTRR